MMKKMLISVFIISTVLFCSCGKDPAVAGDTLIKNARVDYRSLDSARVVMTNTETNEVEQTFEFKYDEKGFLTYSYEGVNGDEAYAQYNNGAESYTYENGKFEYLRKGDKNFAVYTRDITHPQADEGLVVFMPKAVADAEVTEEDGVTHVCHKYDAEKLNQTGVTEFAVDYYFDANGDLLYFVESSVMDSDKHSYKVEITQRNSVDKVANTAKKYEK